jgi:hypothetical protein
MHAQKFIVPCPAIAVQKEAIPHAVPITGISRSEINETLYGHPEPFSYNMCRKEQLYPGDSLK